MIIMSAHALNFGSYESLDFRFDGQGLCLVSGPTGSGKSTLMDIVPWVLFGRTAKNGGADEVRSWEASASTAGTVEVHTSAGAYLIVRTRGPNDLYFTTGSTSYTATRGKDLNDTQKLINELLGCNFETFTSGSYFHEFSQTASFFTTNAKTRRQIIEQMSDMSLAKTLSENLTEYRKELKSDITDNDLLLGTSRHGLKMLNQNIEELKLSAEDWESKRQKKLAMYKVMRDNFETTRKLRLAEIEESKEEEQLTLTRESDRLQKQLKSDSYFIEKRFYIETAMNQQPKADVCPTCGHSSSNSTNKLMLTKELYSLQNEENENASILRTITRIQNDLRKLDARYAEQVQQANNAVNNNQEKIDELKNEANPHKAILKKNIEDRNQALDDVEKFEQLTESLNSEVSDIEKLLEINDVFRAELIKNVVYQLQENTNKLLEKHFDAEIRVMFEVSDADKIEVSILKDGNSASYTQLSKGQRQLLRLCYGVSVMKAVSNYSGVDFNCIMLDEPLDGCDEQLRLKAFNLLNELSLSHSSVFCIEHNEALKNLFTNRYEVELNNGTSQIKEV